MSSTFTIDADNNITAFASAEEASQGDATGLVHFDSQAALAKVSADWPLSRFIEIWNGIPGQSPVKKFQDRKKAVARVWSIQLALQAAMCVLTLLGFSMRHRCYLPSRWAYAYYSLLSYRPAFVRAFGILP
jgi:hypothetical protein